LCDYVTGENIHLWFLWGGGGYNIIIIIPLFNQNSA